MRIFISNPCHPLTHSGRTFVTNAGRFHDPFLREIGAGAVTTTIAVPNTLAGSWLSLFQEVDEEPLWGVNRQSIFVELQAAFKAVATVREGAFIEGPAGIEQSPDGSITFTVKDRTTGRSADYRLVRFPMKVLCASRLKVGRAVSLGP
jgi:hypothetical protein